MLDKMGTHLWWSTGFAGLQYHHGYRRSRGGANRRIRNVITTRAEEDRRPHGQGVNCSILRLLSKLTTRVFTIKFGFINPRSVQNKSTALSEHLLDRSFDLAAVTETWLSSSNQASVLNNLYPEGFAFLSKPREKEGRGEGVGLFHTKSIGVRQHNLQFQPTTFEYLYTTICNARPVHLIIIYPPPHHPERMASKQALSS